jgi:hypothetical protein
MMIHYYDPPIQICALKNKKQIATTKLNLPDGHYFFFKKNISRDRSRTHSFFLSSSQEDFRRGSTNNLRRQKKKIRL